MFRLAPEGWPFVLTGLAATGLTGVLGLLVGPDRAVCVEEQHPHRPVAVAPVIIAGSPHGNVAHAVTVEIILPRVDDQQAVVDAVNKSDNGSGKTFANLLSEWGVAVMLSDYDNLFDTPVYNIGALFDDVYGSINYEMRSINLFNYSPPPTTYTTSGTIQPQGNYYYHIGDDLTGDISISLELNGQTEATLIAK